MPILSDYIVETIDNRGKNPKAYVEYSKHPVIDNFLIKNTLYPDVKSVNRYIDEETYRTFLRGYTYKNMPLMTLVGNGIGNVTLSPNEDIAIIQNTIGLVCKETLDDIFLYYYLLYKQEEIRKFDRGSGQPSIRKTDLLGMSVDIPDLDRQKKIADILFTIDSKIENNKKINNNLVEQLFSIYTEMMDSAEMDMETTLGSLCNFQEGYVNPAQTHPEYFDGDVKWLRAVDINESFIINTSRTLTQIGFESAKKSALLFKPNTIAISKSGTIGRLGIIADYMCGNRAVINIEPHNKFHLPFIYAYLKSRQREFPDMSVGSVQKNLYVSLLEPLLVPVPKESILCSFCDIGTSILSSIHNNCEESQRLTILRDTLLPKLMSGELDVSKIDI